jgi:hypothetical protein
MILIYEGDEESDSAEMYEALREYVTEAMDTGEPVADGSGLSFTGNDFAFVSHSGDTVAWVIAGDPVVGATLRGWLADF